MLPGASKSVKFDVITTAKTVLILLLLKTSEDTITIGRRNPGSDPLGSANDAHQISPFFTTTHPSQ